MEEPPSRPGSESLQHLKQIGSTIGSFALKPLRDFALAEKLNAMNIDMEKRQQQKDIQIYRKQLEDQDRERREKERASELLARQMQDEEEQDECERIKLEADRACERVGKQYDSLLKFIEGNPAGTYDEFIEFLLVDGGRNTNDENENVADDYNALLFENFYDENSPYRKLWNDNLTLGLSEHASTMEGRHFVAAIPAYDSNASNEYQVGLKDSPSSTTRARTHSEDERLRDLGKVIRDRTAQIDKTKLKQHLGSALSMVSNIALKPLRDMEIAEKLNAMNLDMEDAEAQREIEQHMRKLQEEKELEEMMRIKKEAEESCLEATKDHLLEFLSGHPNASYNEWIEDCTLLEGLSKTIDHRFYVEESDHRRLWNDNLHTYLDPNSKGRAFVTARAKQMKDNGDYVDAEDLLSGGDEFASGETNEGDTDGFDLINFD
eukprot:scaffold4795_cov140-Skeletonema_menzelii.AAC.4